MAQGANDKLRQQRDREKARRQRERAGKPAAPVGGRFDPGNLKGQERTDARTAFQQNRQQERKAANNVPDDPTKTPPVGGRFEFERNRFQPDVPAGADRDAARLAHQEAEQARRIAERQAFQQQRQDDRKNGPPPPANNLPPDFGSQDADFAITPELMQMFLDQDSIVGNEALMSQVRAMNPNLLKGGRQLTNAEWENRVRAAMGLPSAHAGTTPFRVFDPNTGKMIATGQPGTNQGGGGGGGFGGGGFSGGGGFGGGGGGFGGPYGNVPGIGNEGITEQGDTFSFENDPILGGRIDELLEGMEGVEDSDMRGLIGDAISGIIMANPNADPNVVLDRLANVREQMIPLRESAKSRVATDLARMGLADSPAVMAQALAGVESEINNQITQRWREIVDDEQARAQEQYMQGIQLGQNQEESDRNFKIQQMDQALKRAGIEAQERLDLIRLANDARAVFNSGRQIDANIALDNLRLNLDFQRFLHTQGMDLAQFQLAVEQARFGNGLDLQRLLLQYMGNIQNGYV